MYEGAKNVSFILFYFPLDVFFQRKILPSSFSYYYNTGCKIRTEELVHEKHNGFLCLHKKS